MNKVIIDSNLSKYKPLLYLSKIDFFEIKINTFREVYIYIDDVSYLGKFNFSENVIFIVDKNILLPEDFIVIVKDYNFDDKNFKEKIVRFEFIRRFIL